MSTALIFPGQGAQFVGMGRDLHAASAAARAVFAHADATLELPLTELCFAGPEAALMATENAQPALLTVSVALLATLSERAGSEPTAFVAQQAAFVAGHSLGEYSALVAAGAFDFATALRLVRRRGELMAQARNGAMAAIIGLEEGPLEAICVAVTAAHGPVVIANYNAPGQLVISGTQAGIEQAIAAAKAHGAKRALPLKVSAAFHSPLMQAAASALAPLIAEATIRDPQVPVISNVNAAPITRADAIRSELVAQITAPVRWIASVETMQAHGVDAFVEVGAGNVLTGLTKRIAPAAALVNINSAASVAAYTRR